MIGHCPRCNTSLEETVVGSVHVDGCNGCGGVWFDNRELGTIAQAQSADLKSLEDRFLPGAAAVTAGDMTCPVCNVLLFEFEFKHSPGIKLDACPQCRGIWADDGELQAIHDRVMLSLAQTATARPTERAMTTRQKARQAVSFLASRNCPTCGESNPHGSVVCWACGSALVDRRDMVCPSCEIPLTGYSFFGGTRIDICQGCCGVWLDHRELAEVVRRPESDIQQIFDVLDKPVVNTPGRLASEQEYLCPVCSKLMEERQYGYNSGIRIDVCDSCNGVWLGTDELHRTVEYYKREQNFGMEGRV